nr:hypothetical protein BaRGS_006872 [Batillaria attramentaria]
MCDAGTDYQYWSFQLLSLWTLLDVWKAEVLEGQSDYEELAEELIVKVLQMPWHSRSRYKPLALLVPAVDTDKVNVHLLSY